MTAFVNRQIVLAARPTGKAGVEHFRLQEGVVDPDALAEGQVLVRHHYLSLDPYMRGRMNEGRSYAAPQPLGEVMIGGTAGEVLASRHPAYAVGDRVVGMGGWQEYQRVDARERGVLHKVDTARVPLSAYLGAVGMPGVTAWVGLQTIVEPKPGETVVVSAASGAVGSVVGQLAKVRGCRAVGIAGGAEKCAWVREVAGFDDCIDYKAHPDLKSLAQALKAACPDGIDGAFENVGGLLLDAVMLRMNAFGRIAVCGMIAGYDGQPLTMANPALILVSRLKIQGFIVSERLDLWPAALAELGGLVASGRLRYRETVAEGLASAPAAFIGLLEGRNFGKQLVRLV
jgi:NADPH-dependent curcumin reductase CurA